MDTLLSDEELTALALAADPDVQLGADAVPFLPAGPPGDDLLLPSWYMPAAAGSVGARRGWRRRVAILPIIAFLLIDAAGLCTTYGPVTFG